MNISVKLDKPQSLICAALAAGAIFSGLNYQGHDFSYRWNMLALFILLLLSVMHLLTHYPRPLGLSRHQAWISYSLLMLWSLASLLWSAVPSDSVLFWSTQLTGVFALYLGYQASPEQWHSFKALLLPLALAVAGYTLYQSQVLHIDRPSGFLLNWNTNAAFLGLLMLPFCAGFLSTEAPFKRHGLGLCLLISALAMAVTQSRGGLLVLFIGLAPLCWLQYRQNKNLRRVGQMLLYLALGYVIAEFLQDGALTQRMAQIGTAGLNADTLKSMGSGRHALWSAGWHMYLDRPFLGWGLGMFHWLYPQYRDPLLLERGNLVHNDYLDTLLGVGPVGLMLLLLFVFSVARLFWQALQSKNVEYLALAGGALGILIHSFFTFNLHQSAIVIVLGFYVGYLAQALQTPSGADRPAQNFNKNLYFGLTGVSAVAFSFWLLTLFMGFQFAERAAEEDRPEKRLAYLNQAQQWLPYMALYDYLLADTVIDLLKQEKPEGIKPEELQAMVRYAMDKVNNVLRKNPLDAENYRNRAELLAMNAQTPEQQREVLENYQQALYYDPYDLVARSRIAEILERQGRKAEGRRLLLAGLNRAYFADPKTGLNYLARLKLIFEAALITPEQRELLNRQFENLALRALKYQMDNFVLQDLGIEE